MKSLALALLTLALVACGGDPPPEREPRQRSLRSTGEAADTPPEGILAPIDQWRARLADEVPVPWTLARVEQQIEAPAGWSRIRGPRGLRLEISDGTSTQTFWVMASRFEGEETESNPALACGKNDEFLLYRAHETAAGWASTAEVAAALGLK
jgi:hypothetical protein